MSTRFITSRPYSISEYCLKLQNYGFLIGVLAKRELNLKYSRTLLGLGWLFLQPLVLVLVYSFFFQHIIKIQTPNVPYPAFVFSGLVLWYIFTGIISKCANAFHESKEFVHKVSFPKLIILIARVIPVIIECFVMMILLFIVLVLNKQHVGLQAFTTLFYFANVVIWSFTLGLACSLVGLWFRDFIHVIPFILNFGIWLTPVFYSVAVVPAGYRGILRYVNPLTIPLEGFRGALFFNSGISSISCAMFALSLLILFLLLYIFIFFEKKIVELL